MAEIHDWRTPRNTAIKSNARWYGLVTPAQRLVAGILAALVAYRRPDARAPPVLWTTCQSIFIVDSGPPDD